MRPRVLQRHQRGRALGDEFSVSRDIAFSLLEIGLGAGEQAFHLPDLGFDRAAIEREQEVAFAHQRTIAEVHAGDLAVHPRLDRDAGNRGDGSQHFEADGNDLLDRGHDFDRDRADPILAGRLRNRSVRPQTAACRYDDRARRDKHHHRPRHQRPLLHYRAAQALERPTRDLPLFPGALLITIFLCGIDLLTYP